MFAVGSRWEIDGDVFTIHSYDQERESYVLINKDGQEQTWNPMVLMLLGEPEFARAE